jgi:hypothetical protein
LSIFHLRRIKGICGLTAEVVGLVANLESRELRWHKAAFIEKYKDG